MSHVTTLLYLLISVVKKHNLLMIHLKTTTIWT